MNNIPRLFLAAILLLTGTLLSEAQEKRALTLADMMKFRQISSPVISDDGAWVAYTAKPDRGDPEVVVRSTGGTMEFIMKQGEKAAISGNSTWVAAVKTAPARELIIAKKDKPPKAGMTLLNTLTGKQKITDSVQSFQFSNDSRWLVYHSFIDSALVVKSLEGRDSFRCSRVTKFAIDSLSRYLAYVVSDTGSLGNGLYIKSLGSFAAEAIPAYTDSATWAGELSWNNKTGQLAFLAGLTGKKGMKKDAALHLWSPEKGDLIALEDSSLEEGWKIHHSNHLEWSKDGLRLFLGIKPESELVPPKEEADSSMQLYDLESILADRGVDVWHWNDPYINSQQKKLWKKEKDRVYTGVYQVSDQRFVALADQEMPDVEVGTGQSLLLGSSKLPYAQRSTWEPLPGLLSGGD